MEKRPLLNQDKNNPLDKLQTKLKLSQDISQIQHIQVQIEQVKDMMEDNVKKLEEIRAPLLKKLADTSTKLMRDCEDFKKVTKDLKDKHKAIIPMIILGCICGILLTCVVILVYIELQREPK